MALVRISEWMMRDIRPEYAVDLHLRHALLAFQPIPPGTLQQVADFRVGDLREVFVPLHGLYPEERGEPNEREQKHIRGCR